MPYLSSFLTISESTNCFLLSSGSMSYKQEKTHTHGHLKIHETDQGVTSCPHTSITFIWLKIKQNNLMSIINNSGCHFVEDTSLTFNIITKFEDVTLSQFSLVFFKQTHSRIHNIVHKI